MLTPGINLPAEESVFPKNVVPAVTPALAKGPAASIPVENTSIPIPMSYPLFAAALKYAGE